MGKLELRVPHDHGGEFSSALLERFLLAKGGKVLPDCTQELIDNIMIFPGHAETHSNRRVR